MSSFVNKSGKKVAPKAPPRRRVVAKTASVTSQITPPEVDDNQTSDVTQPPEPAPPAEVETVNSTLAQSTAPQAQTDSVRPTPPAQVPERTIGSAQPATRPLPTPDATPAAQPEARPEARPGAPSASRKSTTQPPKSTQWPLGPDLPEAPIVRTTSRPNLAASTSEPGVSTPQPSKSQKALRTARPSKTLNSERIVPLQNQWRVAVPTAPVVRASPKPARRLRASSSTTVTNEPAEDGWQVTTQAELRANTPRDKGKGPVDQQSAVSSAASRRLANAVKRKRKEAERNSTVNRLSNVATASAIDDVVMASIEGREVDVEIPVTRGAGTTEPDEAENNEQPILKRRSRRPGREPTPDENEEVMIVPGITRMNDLTKDMRVGFKSEREKMMRTIDWAEVKRRRKEDEQRQALHRGRPDDEDDPMAEREDGEEELDEDEQIERALERQRRRGQNTLRIRLVGGEHVIDEQSQYVDRHARVDEEIEMLEEVEEDDLTKKFNVATYVTWRRKDPAERILTHEKWNIDSTDRFYDCLYQFGTDFMTISKMFPGRTRRHIKSKFVKEERADPERVKDALLGHLTRNNHGEGWDLKAFMEGSGMKESDLKDPKALNEELRLEREAMEKEIDTARKETEAEEAQMRLAGYNPDEEDAHGNPLSPDEVLRRATEKAAKLKKEKAAARKAKKHGPATGGEEEIVEDIIDDD
jgi:transcription factor TFIIIB component B''